MNQTSEREIMIQMITGGLVAQLIRVVAQLGVADVLAEGPKSSAELATRVGAHPRALYRVLRALASAGIFAETPDGQFELTPLALPLQVAAPESLQALAIMWGELLWRPYGNYSTVFEREKSLFPTSTAWDCSTISSSIRMQGKSSIPR